MLLLWNSHLGTTTLLWEVEALFGLPCSFRTHCVTLVEPNAGMWQEPLEEPGPVSSYLGSTQDNGGWWLRGLTGKMKRCELCALHS